MGIIKRTPAATPSGIVISIKKIIADIQIQKILILLFRIKFLYYTFKVLTI
jgi:hypothetical protein